MSVSRLLGHWSYDESEAGMTSSVVWNSVYPPIGDAESPTYMFLYIRHGTILNFNYSSVALFSRILVQRLGTVTRTFSLLTG